MNDLGIKGMVDFHSHILPQIDDGSGSAEESVELLKMLYGQGVESVVATPHFYPNQTRFEDFLREREESLRVLCQRVEQIKNDGIMLPEVFVGAEVAYFKGIARSAAIGRLCIEGTSLLLVEMPFFTWTNEMIDEMLSIGSALGITPIIAHIERYLKYQKKSILNELLDGDVLIQSNAEAFLDKGTKGKMLKLFGEGKIDLLGSDCHGLSERYPNMREAAGILCGKFGFDAMKKMNLRGKQLLCDAERVI